MEIDPNWVTAAFTGLIVIATAIGSFAAWRSYKAAQRARDPRIDYEPKWSKNGSLFTTVSFTNAGDQPIRVLNARVVRPRGATLVLQRSRPEESLEPAKSIKIDRNVAAFGTGPQMIGVKHKMRVAGTADKEDVRITIHDLPASAAGGPIVIEFAIVIRSEAVRTKRIPIRRTIPPMPSFKGDF